MSVVMHVTVSVEALAMGLLDPEIPTTVVACPGNGTRYFLVLTPILNPEAAADLFVHNGSVLVSLWPGHKHSACAVFRRDGSYLAPMYVAEKLSLKSDADAHALAVILGELLDRPHPGTVKT